MPHSGDFRARRSRAARRAAIRRRQSAAAVVVAMLLAALFVAVAVLTQGGGGSPATTTNPAPAHRVKTPPLKTAARRGAATRHEATRLVERLGGRLPAGIEDPAAAAAAGRIILAGGLTAQDTSSTTILSVRGRATRSIGQLPAAQHDAPAARWAGFVYVFGGGDGVRQLDHILRIDPRSGRVTSGRAAARGEQRLERRRRSASTAYVVGGYTGTRWLDTIVAFRPGRDARGWSRTARRRCATRPSTAVADDARDRRRVAPERVGLARRLRFDPRRSRVVRIASLPVADDARCRGRLGGTVVHHRRARRCARLGQRRDRGDRSRQRPDQQRPDALADAARSDLAAVALGRSIVVAGGGTTAGVTAASASSLGGARSGAALRSPSAAAANVYAADRRERAHGRRPPGARARLRAEQPVEHDRRHRPAHVQGRSRHYAVGALPAARHALVRPAHALRRQRPLEQPHADRPGDRPARAAARFRWPTRTTSTSRPTGASRSSSPRLAPPRLPHRPRHAR